MPPPALEAVPAAVAVVFVDLAVAIVVFAVARDPVAAVLVLPGRGRAELLVVGAVVHCAGLLHRPEGPEVVRGLPAVERIVVLLGGGHRVPAFVFGQLGQVVATGLPAMVDAVLPLWPGTARPQFRARCIQRPDPDLRVRGRCLSLRRGLEGCALGRSVQLTRLTRDATASRRHARCQQRR